MNKIEEEFENFDKTNAWTSVYQKIRQDSTVQHDFSVTDAKRVEFKSRNRYRDVSPYDHSRVRLVRDGVDYINASLVEYPLAERSYILTQGPLPNTSSHFWLMVWEQNSGAILMLNRVVEMGKVKCHQYFPMSAENEDEEEIIFEDVGLKVSFISEENANFYLVRTLEIEDIQSGERKQVLQFHYMTWPDFGVPDSPEEFLSFLYAVRKAGVLEKSVGPAVIHCSAGIGRSGTFCLVDTCLLLIEKNQDPDCISVCDVLMEMRQYRMGLIQTADQLRFSYLAIIEGCKHILLPNCADSGIYDNHLYQSSSSGGSSLPADDLGDIPPSTPPPIPPRSGPPADPSGTQHTGGTPIKNSHIPTLANAGELSRPELRQRNLGSDEDEGISAGSLLDDMINLQDQRRERQEIHRRRHEDRRKKSADQIALMKRKQQEHELFKNRKKSTSKYVWGLSLAVLISSYIVYRYYGT